MSADENGVSETLMSFTIIYFWGISEIHIIIIIKFVNLGTVHRTV